MEPNLEKSITSSQQLHIDRKMIGILSVFAILGVCLVITIIIATSTLSGLRAFGSMQTHWTQTRKQATFHLVHLIESEDTVDYSKFDSSLTLIRNATFVLDELLKPDADKEIVRQKFLEIHTMPNDIGKMIKAFERFHGFGNFLDAVQTWKESDVVIEKMEVLAEDVKNLIDAGSPLSPSREQLVEQALQYDTDLTDLQHSLAASLASGTQFLNNVIILISTSLGFLLLLIGGILSVRFLKRIKNWQLTIEVNEQKFRSLFEHNPNAVYSFSKDGQFITGNKALSELSGYSISEVKSRTFEGLVAPADLKKTQENFEKAADGIPQSYEAVLIRKNQEEIVIEVTNLPIYVDGEIVGVFGVAYDITGRKKAEEQINRQLKEKTLLLSEVHDRVKNNLALISGLIQLENEYKRSEKTESLYQNTIRRIQSMAMIHDRLYHTNTFSSIRMDEYVKELSESVKMDSDFNGDAYQLNVEAEPVTLSVKKAIPTGLLLNELLVNTFSYAFTGRKSGKVDIELFQQGREVVFKISDNGIGLPKDFNIENPQTMGMKLVSILSRQLEASLHCENKTGTTFILRFTSEQGIYKSA